VKVLDHGLLTTIQDLGRMGFAKDGVGPGGAMDRDAIRVANVLVHNPEGAAALEITLVGPAIEFEDDAFIAICGADLSPRIADVAIPSWRAVYVQQGSVLSFGPARWGCRAYLAVAGGIDVPEVMGSRSTYLRAGIGGVEGRALQAGDSFPVADAPPGSVRSMQRAAEAIGPLPFALSERSWDDPARLYRAGAIRFVPGPHWELMDDGDRARFTTDTFTISTDSDRMGYRLSGPPLRSVGGEELISTAVLTGTVQVPPGGAPIVLMADRQTTGGYPMVAQVITADLPTVAQRRPGDEILFEASTVELAQQELRAREGAMEDARRSL
jgi:antagonist of KipI